MSYMTPLPKFVYTHTPSRHLWWLKRMNGFEDLTVHLQALQLSKDVLLPLQLSDCKSIIFYDIKFYCEFMCAS